ncbi:hypothetical protein L1049_007288 [Liquidambar formosana]|uniref:Uncharacterized protein n=1 Tax=Liquidambar formosana TaxID=63359 RepID=A0AAP0RKF6_LIQFO
MVGLPMGVNRIEQIKGFDCGLQTWVLIVTIFSGQPIFPNSIFSVAEHVGGSRTRRTCNHCSYRCCERGFDTVTAVSNSLGAGRELVSPVACHVVKSNWLAGELDPALHQLNRRRR